MTEVSLLELRCEVQQNEWGKLGWDSLVATLKAEADPSFEVISEKPYAELWMGTHPNRPTMAKISETVEIPLEEWVKQHPHQLGAWVNTHFNGNLPFLFKVLSVRTVLALQAHPDKSRARILHQVQPSIYKDSNHKPEMVIALTPFLGLCGFRPIHELARFLQTIPEFREAVGESAKQLTSGQIPSDVIWQERVRKECFTEFMNRHEEDIRHLVSSLITRVLDMKKSGDRLTWAACEADVLLKLHQDFPLDRGCLALYFLNVARLAPGEAIFLDVNVPHAYISGDCVECMACSDNVVRSAFSHKYKDIPTLCSMLDYSARTLSDSGIRSTTKVAGSEGTFATLYSAPVSDFSITMYKVPKDQPSFSLESMDSASICIVIEGQGSITDLKGTQLFIGRGSVFYLAAETQANFLSVGVNVLLFRAHAGGC